MIVIVFDNECQMTHGIAMKIRNGIEREGLLCQLMPINDISEQNLNDARCIIFGCRTGFVPGISYKMAKYMNRTDSIFSNQVWKNKFAAGFTTNTGTNSVNVIQDLCNFSARHSMIWISQGHLAENEGHNVFYGSSSTRVNSNKSFLGCIATADQSDFTAECFGKRIAQRIHDFLNPNRQ